MPQRVEPNASTGMEATDVDPAGELPGLLPQKLSRSELAQCTTSHLPRHLASPGPVPQRTPLGFVASSPPPARPPRSFFRLPLPQKPAQRRPARGFLSTRSSPVQPRRNTRHRGRSAANILTKGLAAAVSIFLLLLLLLLPDSLRLSISSNPAARRFDTDLATGLDWNLARSPTQDQPPRHLLHTHVFTRPLKPKSSVPHVVGLHRIRLALLDPSPDVILGRPACSRVVRSTRG